MCQWALDAGGTKANKSSLPSWGLQPGGGQSHAKNQTSEIRCSSAVLGQRQGEWLVLGEEIRLGSKCYANPCKKTSCCLPGWLEEVTFKVSVQYLICPARYSNNKCQTWFKSKHLPWERVATAASLHQLRWGGNTSAFLSVSFFSHFPLLLLLLHLASHNFWHFQTQGGEVNKERIWRGMGRSDRKVLTWLACALQVSKIDFSLGVGFFRECPPLGYNPLQVFDEDKYISILACGLYPLYHHPLYSECLHVVFLSWA